MALFDELQKLYAFLGVDPLKYPQQSVLNIKNVTTLIILTQGFITANVYLFFEASTFNEYVDAFWVSCSSTLACVNFTILILQTPKVFNFMDKFELIIQERMEKPVSKVIHEESIQNLRKWTKVMDILMMGSVYLTVLPKLFVSFFHYFTTSLGCDAFELPYLMWYPFDWRNPYKYPIAFSLQYGLLAFGIKHATCHTSCISGSCYMLVSFAKDLSNEINTTNAIAIDVKERLKLFELMSQFVENHATGKQLVDDFTKAYKLIILFFFFWCTVTTAGSLLVIRIEINAGHLSVLPILIFQMCWSLGYAYIFCEFGERSNNEFVKLYDETCQLNWYSFPIKVQQMIPMIMNAQQNSPPIRFSKKIQCTREFFKGMCNSAFSYFTMLSQLVN